jgi:hypothetical protein
MARKRYSDEDALKILREIDVHLHEGGYFGQDLLLLAQEVRWSRATAALRNESTEEGKRAAEKNRCGPKGH